MSRLLELANAGGRRSLAQEGLMRVAMGVTTLDEVLRATGGAVSD